MSGFEIVERRVDLPFRSRKSFTGYAVFQSDGHAVFVHSRVCRLLAVATRDAEPCETGGLLAGRVLRDAEGPYTLVLEAVKAPREAGRPGRLTLSPEMTARLRDQAATEFPGCDVVGWWHSHTVETGYSEVDRANQQMWTDPSHVGLLVFARATSRRALAYLGPASRLMRTVDDQAFEPGQRRQDARHDAATRVSDPPVAAPAMETVLRLRQLDRGWRRTMVAAMVACGLAMLGCLIGVERVAGAVREINVTERAAAGWSCLPRASDQFVCRSSPPFESLQWWQDGRPVSGSAEQVVVTVAPGGSTWVELRRHGDGGSQLLGGVMLASALAGGVPLPGHHVPALPQC